MKQKPAFLCIRNLKPNRISKENQKPISCLIRNNLDQYGIHNPASVKRAQDFSFKSIPGPKGLFKLPFIGLLFHFKPFGKYSSATFHNFLKELNVGYGNIVRQRIGNRWMVFLFDPSDIQGVLYQDEKYPVRSETTIMHSYARRNGVPLSLAFQDGDKWAELRKPTQEKLQKISVIGRYTPALSHIAEEFVKHVGTSGQMVDTVMDLTRLSIENAGMFCFNKRLGCFGNDMEKQRHIVSNIIVFLECLGESFDRIPTFNFLSTPFYKVFEKSYTEIRRQIWTLLDESMQTIPSEERKREDGLSSELSLLQSLLLDPRMSADQVHSVIIDIFIAGIDATANALSFVLYNLAKNPHVQDKLFQEITLALDTNEPIGQSTFSNMPYMKACIKESLRIVPPLRDGTRRILDKDMTVAGYHIPKGNILVMCNSVIGLNEEYFQSPLEYRPERWLRNGHERSSIHPFAVLPFGFGPRNCIGQRFAELQMHVIITKLVQQYKLTLPRDNSEVGHTYKLFAAPDRKFSVILTKR